MRISSRAGYIDTVLVVSSIDRYAVEMGGALWRVRATFPKIDPQTGGVALVEVDDFIVPWRFDAIAVRGDRDAREEWPVIAMQLEMVGARPSIRELTLTHDRERVFGEQGVRVRDADEALDVRWRSRRVNASLLREIPLARLAKHAMLGVAYRLRDANADGAALLIPYELRDDDGFFRVGADVVADEHEPEGLYNAEERQWEPFWSERPLWSTEMKALAALVERAATPKRGNRITDELLAQVRDIYRQAMEEGQPPKKAVQAALHVSEPTAGRYVQRARDRGLLGPTLPGKKGELSDPSTTAPS